jgi:hypothetical protein
MDSKHKTIHEYPPQLVPIRSYMHSHQAPASCSVLRVKDKKSRQRLFNWLEIIAKTRVCEN